MNVGRRPELMDVYIPEELRNVEQREVASSTRSYGFGGAKPIDS